MRERIYDIIDSENEHSTISSVYDLFMIAIIGISILPLAFKHKNQWFHWIEQASVTVFIVDYLLRLLTADYKLRKSRASFLLYPITPMAIIDLLSILPFFSSVDSGFKLFRALRLFRTFRTLKVFKLFRYSENIEILANVFRRQKGAFLYVGVLTLGYIIITALIIFQVEPETFDHFFDAIWWATTALTSRDAGGIDPVTPAGKVFTIISSLVGIAIIALPVGIISAGYMAEITERHSVAEVSSETVEREDEGP